VRDGAKRMRQLPRREGVRRVALMHDRERRDEIRVGEVGIELLDLRGEEEPLVDDRPRRAGADVGVLRRLLDLPADDVEISFEISLTQSSRSPRSLFRRILCALCGLGVRYKHLPYPRHYAARVVSDGIGVRRHVAPGEDLAPLALHRRSCYKLRRRESVAIAEMIEKYRNGENVTEI